MNFGKYMLYSCYGTTANGNTSPLAFGILFGNEDKEGWLQFWKFAKNLHPCLNDETITIITDRGGNVKYSCLWLFNKLVKASSKREIEHIKHKHAPYMDI